MILSTEGRRLYTLCLFIYIFAAFNRYGDIINTLKAVGYDDGASGGKGRESVFPGTVHMLCGVFTLY